MGVVLETIELPQETSTNNIFHAICFICEDETGESRGFCGTLLNKNSGSTRQVEDWHKCAMCVEVIKELPAGECPRGHLQPGILL